MIIIFVSFIFILNISIIRVGQIHAHVINQQKTVYVINVISEREVVKHSYNWVYEKN